jgi:DNA-directed RNA polymerase specialized sigma24 family protein
VSNTAAVSQHLPFLRRYARALTGNQASGDAYVAATLEALIADRDLIDEPRGARVGLYRLFTRIWNSVSINGASVVDEASLPGEQKLANITPLPRQAFLLVALEGFSELDAAHVLDVDAMKLARRRCHEAARAGRGVRPRARGRDRDRGADHRG